MTGGKVEIKSVHVRKQIKTKRTTTNYFTTYKNCRETTKVIPGVVVVKADALINEEVIAENESLQRYFKNSWSEI